MNNIFKNLKSDQEYKVLDVNLIERTEDRKSIRIRTIFAHKQDNQTFFIARYANVQFGRYIRVGMVWKNNTGLKPEGMMLTELPSAVLSTYGKCKWDHEILHSCELVVGKYDMEGAKEHAYAQKVCVYEFTRQLEINGTKVSFLIIPTYEIIRFFLFGPNKYNEILLGGNFVKNDDSNKIFNPEKSVERVTEQGKIKVIRLRKEIPNTCAQIAGDLKYNHRVQSLALTFVNTANTLNHESWERKRKPNAFQYAFMPTNSFSKFRAYGKFVNGIDGDKGFKIESIAELIYGEKYYYERDNDGTSTDKKKFTMPKSFGGKKKRKLNNKKKLDKSVHDKLGDKEIESIKANEIIDSHPFEDRDMTGIKVVKTDQEHIADTKTPGDPVDGKGVGASSGNSDRGTGNAPVDTDVALSEDHINGLKYWAGFGQIIEKIRLELAGELLCIRYLNSRLEWVGDEAKTNYNALDEIEADVQIFVVEISVNMCSFYVIEHNADEYSTSTLIFWEKYGQVPFTLEIQQLIAACYVGQGNGRKVLDYLKDEMEIEYRAVRHAYEMKNTEPTKYYSTEEAISNQARKIVAFIRTKVMGE